MRLFTLFDGSGTEFPITTKTCFFHAPEGLGYEEVAVYFPIAYQHSLLASTHSQGVISGSMIFVDDSWEEGGKTPYQRGFEFTQFCTNKTLQMYYQPHGEGTVGYYRDVRLSKYDKSEISELGILEVAVEFTCLTPWYRQVSVSPNGRSSEEEDDGGWIWENHAQDEGDSIWKVVTGHSANGFIKWGYETRYGRAIINTADFGDNILPSPCALIVYGPASNPTWTHYVNDNFVASGSFAQTVSIGDIEQLVVDNTSFPYRMIVRNVNTGAIVNDVYQIRNFNTVGFITLQSGLNRISIDVDGDTQPQIALEGRLYYGSV